MSRLHCLLCDTTKKTSGNVPIAFHRFPTKKEIRSTWMKVCNLSEVYDDVSSKTVVLCSKHFTQDDYIDINARKFGGQLKLKYGAIPSMAVPNPPQELQKVDVINVASLGKEEIGSCYSTDIKEIKISISSCAEIGNVERKKKKPKTERSRISLGSAGSIIERQKKTIKQLHEENRRLTERVTLLEGLLNELRENNFLSEDVDPLMID